MVGHAIARFPINAIVFSVGWELRFALGFGNQNARHKGPVNSIIYDSSSTTTLARMYAFACVDVLREGLCVDD